MLNLKGMIEVKFNLPPNENSMLAELRIAEKYCDRFELGYDPNKKPAPLDDLIRISCEVMGVTVEQFKSGKKDTPFVWARRFVACYQQINTRFTLTTIGLQTGSRDHCSVLHDKNKHIDWYLFDHEYTDCVERFMDGIRKLDSKYSCHMKFPSNDVK